MRLVNNTYDVIVSNCVFNLIPYKKQPFEEKYRVLKACAILYIPDVFIKYVYLKIKESSMNLCGLCNGWE